MAKKFMVLAMAVGALVAFAAPAAASANTGQLTDGKPLAALAKGAVFLATSSNVTTITPAGSLVCKKVTLNLTVNTNSASGSTSSGNGNSPLPSGCEVEQNGASVTITSVTVSNVTLAPTAAGSFASFVFTYDIPAALLTNCVITGTKVPVTWTGPSTTIHIAGSVVGSGPAGSGCPTTPSSIAGDFSLETKEEKGAVTVD